MVAPFADLNTLVLTFSSTSFTHADMRIPTCILSHRAPNVVCVAMPPRKKSAVPLKVVAGVKWFWENDAGDGYNAFDKSAMVLVESAYQSVKGSGKVKETISGRNYEFDFTKMLQTNTDTGSARRIKREEEGTPLAITWQWKSDSGKWNNYDDDVDARIEGFYDNGDSPVIVKIAGTDYIIDFVEMKQINKKTKGPRDIRRLIGVTESPNKFTKLAGSKTMKAADDGDDDDDDVPAAKKSKLESKPASAPTVSAGGPGKTRMVKKGRGVVDVNSGMQDKAHVYESGPKVYQCTLNQTNIAQNNNKFYVIQLLESDKGGEYWVWTRWGRVGVIGQSNLDKAFSLPAAIAQFNKKFREKTSNDFNNLESFTKVPGKYQLMEMDFGGDDGKDTSATDDATSASVPASKLPPEVQDVIKMISNKGDMEKAMKELEIDTAKMPLGKISKKQIKEAFGYLKLIEAELAKPKPSNADIVSHSSMFYTLVPHDFGFSLPPPIRDDLMLKRKMELLEVLADLEVASKLLEGSKKSGTNPIDASYDSLKCKLTPIPHDSPTFKRIVEYAANTHGATHSAYKLVVEEVFEVDREGEAKRYNATSSGIGNKQLLWHGSRTTNYMGILSQGLRIAPPEAPCTGYMFGKGVYFADSSSKSANYCHCAPSNPEGLMLLCEAALGTMQEYTHAMYMDKPKPGTHSTKGVGAHEPDESEAQVVDGVKWPLGKIGKTPGAPKTTLQYHEYIVYDVGQAKMNYLLKVRFKYKK